MQGAMWGSQFRTTIVCVDGCENSVLSGRIYNPCLPQGDGFRSTIQFLKKMEALLDQMKFPQSFSVNRVFRPSPEIKLNGPPDARSKVGKAGTFALKILFRQNASWQGSVVWLEGGREESFRSVLELLLLMDSAVNTTGIEYGFKDWVPNLLHSPRECPPPDSGSEGGV